MYLSGLKKIATLLSLILICLQLAHAGSAQKTAESDTTIENAILVHINQYRQLHGLNPLKMDSRIVLEAKRHSADMAHHKLPFGHKYFNNRIDRLHRQIKESNAGAENVAFNYKDAEDVVKNWLRSPGHKRNIDGNYNLTGIGIARDAHGKMYFTQIFLKTGSHNKYSTRHPKSALFNIFKKLG
ncbi:CAP domain-containing protein [Legionella worsleiensis]|uniref:Putative transporter n=1 Tax=Legionella worsleiensis TaxID=45076 RepID=A0A0W1A3Q2_9GAMM|nr:CAP domain-containing protein [Legionella worsleiensis]KTD76001.1 putative transporter [Legionella worsleiensis]STY33014.1 putative transporter [Legionella worsleiensis]